MDKIELKKIIIYTWDCPICNHQNRGDIEYKENWCWECKGKFQIKTPDKWTKLSEEKIIFRGKRVDNSEWVEGCYFYDGECSTHYIGEWGLSSMDSDTGYQDLYHKWIEVLTDSLEWQKIELPKQEKKANEK